MFSSRPMQKNGLVIKDKELYLQLYKKYGTLLFNLYANSPHLFHQLWAMSLKNIFIYSHQLLKWSCRRRSQTHRKHQLNSSLTSHAHSKEITQNMSGSKQKLQRKCYWKEWGGFWSLFYDDFIMERKELSDLPVQDFLRYFTLTYLPTLRKPPSC